jgi:hypothetical protein
MNWIIGIGGSDCDDVITERVSGTKRQVKKYLKDLVASDRDNDSEGWDYGTTAIDGESGVEERTNGILYAFGEYDNYHIDYTATPEMDVKVLS